jgi:hypothetical protein
MAKRGNPGYGKLTKIRDEFEAIQSEWWAEMRNFLHSKSKEDRKFALQELNKVQAKLIPTQIEGTGENGEINVTVTNYGNSPSLQLPASTVSAPIITGD